MSHREVDDSFRDRRYEEAIAELRKGLEDQGVDGRDALLYYLDLGLVLHTAGQIEESTKGFLKADPFAEIKDYTSLAAETATLLTTDNIKDYKGEDFEKVLINTYLAMNYALIGDFENALVEARRVNTKLRKMVTEGERKYKQNAFARYLSGILYEASDDPNAAYIDYKFTYELAPDFPGLGRDLWRTARLSGLREEADSWAEKTQLSKEDKAAALLSAPKSGRGEIIVIYENGISPIKRPNPHFTQVPKFYPRHNPVRSARVEVLRPGGGAEASAETAVLHDIEWTAIQNLEEKYGGIVAKKLAGIVAKEVVADQVEKKTKSPLLGALTRLFFYASDQADVRSWNLLPRDLQMVRFAVEPGTYEIKVSPLGAGELQPKTVAVKRGGKTFVAFRYIP